MDVYNVMVRYLVQVYLQSFFTKTSGDSFGKGEFYFKCNGKRYPDKGEFHLKAGQTFDPQPNPTFYTAIVDDKEKVVKFDFEAWEADPGRDDKFIDQKMNVNINPMNQTFELTDKKQRCSLRIVVQVTPSD